MQETVLDNIKNIPGSYKAIWEATEKLDFHMASDLKTGSLLSTLAASRPAGRFLELGTGSGLATSWILKGMDTGSRLTTIEQQPILLDIARKYLADSRIEFILADASGWLTQAARQQYDLIFADAMPGKYELFDEALALLKPGGMYFIDDMRAQPNWPEGHDKLVNKFIAHIDQREDLSVTKMSWSTGIILAVKL